MSEILAAAGIAGATQALGGIWQNTTNEKIARETRDYNREMWTTQMAREDTAVQRRAADLEAAGLSKTLAAGSAATTASPIRAEPYRVENPVQDVVPTMLSVMWAKADVSKTEAETEAINLQKDKLKIDIAYEQTANPQKLAALAAEAKTKELGTELAKLDTQIKKLDIDKSEVTIAKIKVDKDLATWDLKGKEIDYVAKKIALDTAQWNNAWYKGAGLPVGATLDPFSRYSGVAKSALKQLAEESKKNPPSAANSREITEALGQAKEVYKGAATVGNMRAHGGGPQTMSDMRKYLGAGD